MLIAVCLVAKPRHLEAPAGEGAGFHEELFLGADQALPQDHENVAAIHSDLSLDTRREAL